MTDTFEMSKERIFRGFDEFDIPDHMRNGMEGHILYGRGTGHFLEALFIGDFYLMMQRADCFNQRILHRYAKFMYNYAPRFCYGSRENVKSWQELGGLKGHYEKGEMTNAD